MDTKSPGNISYLHSENKISFESIDDMILEFEGLPSGFFHSGVIEFDFSPTSSIVFNEVTKEALLDFAISAKNNKKILKSLEKLDEKTI